VANATGNPFSSLIDTQGVAEGESLVGNIPWIAYIFSFGMPPSTAVILFD